MSIASRVLVFSLLAAAVGRSQATLPQERARQSFERAMSEPDGPNKETLLKESINIYKTFAAYYALGNLQLGENRYKDARESFQNALALVDGVQPMAAAYFKIGLTSEGEGETLTAIAWLEASLTRVNDPTVAKELKRMRLAAAGHTQPAGAIARALTTAKSTGSAPKVDLQVNFEFNRSDLTVSGRSQSEELGKLLEQMNDPAYQMVFIGHTDEKGTDEFNHQLSLERAETVKRYLVERYSIASTKIKTEGHGRREPLYTGTSEENDRLNRRVEVRLVTK